MITGLYIEYDGGHLNPVNFLLFICALCFFSNWCSVKSNLKRFVDKEVREEVHQDGFLRCFYRHLWG